MHIEPSVMDENQYKLIILESTDNMDNEMNPTLFMNTKEEPELSTEKLENNTSNFDSQQFYETFK